MTTSTVVRPLAPSEQMFAWIGVYVGYAVQVTGRLDLAALSAAYEAVVRTYPVLGARLEPTGDGGYTLVAGTGAAPAISVVDDDPDRLLIDQKLDQGETLSAVCVTRADDTASVTLLTHHSIADAYHSLAVLAELWSCYTELVSGQTPVRPVHAYPVSIEEVLAARGIEKRELPAAETGTPTESRPAPPATEPETEEIRQTVPDSSRCLLSEAETTALVELGHRTGVTINGLVSAAILLTEAEIRDLPLSEINYVYPVDLRTRLTPTVGRTDGTNLLGFADYHPTGDTTDLVELAKDICAALHTALADGIVQQTPLHIPDQIAAGPPQLPGMMIVSNWGRVPALAAPDGLRITDFRSTVTAAPPAGTPPPPEQPEGGAAIVSTFAGRLSIETHHSKERIAQEQRRVDTYAAKLRSVIA
ncbi:phthiocerol/phthiodiolone dimycocerosyl transferase family protein [Nocardia brasiliensis]|uniref:Phthiocerol/phthiodiolone dimycocerosyl transferase n=1 Tax=Nocardia brasiliensis (strain ATCC 700358 / HUJEG-1) TaxID=1133849 RepID=K0EPI1_NOCB7|nr:acyltransferase [Nocardia brasiliensis]AFT99346.1 acyltransferase PapA5 [Nocardia brasiliensis ATCC 700358]